MDEDFSIINSNTRNEKIKNFFLNNKKKFISGVIIITICLFGAYSFDKYTKSKKKEISDNYNFTIIEYSNNNKVSTVKKNPCQLFRYLGTNRSITDKQRASLSLQAQIHKFYSPAKGLTQHQKPHKI